MQRVLYRSAKQQPHRRFHALGGNDTLIWPHLGPL
jgi:hypothetical protein